MIVCVCNSLREGACREAACRDECRGVGCVYRMLGARVRCGRCVPHMRALVDEVRQARGGGGGGCVAARACGDAGPMAVAAPSV